MHQHGAVCSGGLEPKAVAKKDAERRDKREHSNREGNRAWAGLVNSSEKSAMSKRAALDCDKRQPER